MCESLRMQIATSIRASMRRPEDYGAGAHARLDGPEDPSSFTARTDAQIVATPSNPTEPRSPNPRSPTPAIAELVVMNGPRNENSQSVSNLSSLAELSVKFTVGPHA